VESDRWKFANGWKIVERRKMGRRWVKIDEWKLKDGWKMH
jgi:hypothetical protein